MGFYTFQEFINVFKKRYKMFILVFVLLCSLFIVANKTFLKDKLNQKYSVTFDYEYFYSWINFTKQSIKFSHSTFNLVCQQNEVNRDTCIEIPFITLKELHSGFFESIYRFNIEDLKSNNFQSKNYKIAQAFNFDTTNFRYKNRKLHISWSNVAEAEKYLQSLHERAAFELLNIAKIIIDENNNRAIENINKKILTFPPMNIGLRIKEQHQLNSDLELEQFVNKTINILKINKINDIDLFKMIFTRKLLHPFEIGITTDSLLVYPFIYDGSNINEKFQNIFSTKRDIIYYYLGTKYNSVEKINEANLFFFPEIQKLIDNFESYLPKYKLIIKKIHRYYIYLIEIFFALFISLIVILTLHIKDREN